MARSSKGVRQEVNLVDEVREKRLERLRKTLAHPTTEETLRYLIDESARQKGVYDEPPSARTPVRPRKAGTG